MALKHPDNLTAERTTFTGLSNMVQLKLVLQFLFPYTFDYFTLFGV
jgi:hypothetical protein